MTSNLHKQPVYRLTGHPLRLALAGGIATFPFVVAAWGWAAHWNVHTNMLFTLGGVWLWVVLIYSTSSVRWRHRE